MKNPQTYAEVFAEIFAKEIAHAPIETTLTAFYFFINYSNGLFSAKEAFRNGKK